MDDFTKSIFDVRNLVGPALVGIVGVMAVIMRDWRRSRSIRHAQTGSLYERTGGGETDFYFDTDLYFSEPDHIGAAGVWFDEVIQEEQREHGNIDRLAFIEKIDGPVGAITLKDFVTWRTNIPSLAVRLRLAEQTPLYAIKGEGWATLSGLKVNERVAVVSDVATKGSTILAAVRLLRAAGAVVPVALVIYDREEGAFRCLREEGIRFKAMFAASYDRRERHEEVVA